MKFIYVDTGAMYRAMALYFIRNGIRPEDGEKISEKCRNADITICYVDGEQVVLLDGENVNERIRTEEVGNMASVSSVNPEVRKKLVELQQRLARRANVVMDGRDIGQCGSCKKKIRGIAGKGNGMRSKKNRAGYYRKG